MVAYPDTATATPGDWWVTAGQALDRVKDRDAAARTAPGLLDTLAEVGELRRAADVALGAAVQALLAAGERWDAIAAALGLADTDEARAAASTAMGEARLALDGRIRENRP